MATTKILESKKIQTLPDDLKSIAEELIRDKFGAEEEVVEQSTASFHNITRQEYPPNDARFDGLHTQFGDGFVDVLDKSTDDTYQYTRYRTGDLRTWFSPYHRTRHVAVSIHSPDTRSIRASIQELDRVNVRQDGRTIMMPPRFARELMASRDYQIFMVYRESDRVGYSDDRHYIGQMFGCKMFVLEGAEPEVKVSW